MWFLLRMLGVVSLASAIASAADDGETIFPDAKWDQRSPAELGMDADTLSSAQRYALTGGGSGIVIYRGYQVSAWGDLTKRYDLKSTTKSIGVTALGLAIKDGKLSLSDKVADRHPSFGIPPESNKQTGWLKEITLKHLATQTAGFEKPGGFGKLLFEPGRQWAYSDGGPNWLAECVTLAYRRDVKELMFERVLTPIGITTKDLTWRRNAYRPKEIDGIPRREFGSGISANVNAMARIGYLYLREGRWKDRQILPEDFVKTASGPFKDVVGIPEHDPNRYGNASAHYGLLWWNNADGTIANLPRDAYWSWGLYDSLIVVVPSLDLVAARAGKSWKRDGEEHYAVLEEFLEPLAKSVKQKAFEGECGVSGNEPAQEEEPPYPSSPVFQSIEWAPKNSIIRLAKGSDNWPVTWGDDDKLYTAYGDGRGFQPFVEKKLSMGLCTITGDPPSIQGENLRAPSLETTGGGASGKKSSGILMVEGVLYLWARNAGNSQLAWSKDRGKTWTWSDWKFTESFGCPAFLQFGRNYANARDDFVYLYSQDSDSAYKRADRFVMARVPKDRIRDRKAYEFFRELKNGEPVWTKNLKNRGAVFSQPGACYRSHVSYHKPSGRYLWCQTGEGKDTRFAGGLGIYDAPEPWGPWTTVFFTKNWDVGSGESSNFPTKWMSADGRSAWLVFSGDDYFSVRKGDLVPRKK